MALAYRTTVSTAPHCISAVLQVESPERDIHAAEKGDDFVDQFHVGILFLI
ncbi:hypothetical protein I6L74_08505 [Lelliottia amnigena]|uniref:hypothetical protein n=1 Tax=Lelliottia amnigena TaxID=61646 RepID=UPI0013E371D8|nr:hypothetical protein [Lelliottia amnigena]QXA23426.1 hypothetical protein I6L74_08505 [Lelliottia amnigena]